MDSTFSTTIEFIASALMHRRRRSNEVPSIVSKCCTSTCRSHTSDIVDDAEENTDDDELLNVSEMCRLLFVFTDALRDTCVSGIGEEAKRAPPPAHIDFEGMQLYYAGDVVSCAQPLMHSPPPQASTSAQETSQSDIYNT